MRPELSRKNIRKALKHPSLLIKSFSNSNEISLAQEHVKIHLDKLSKTKIDFGELSPIDAVCQAVNMFSKSCYHTEYLYAVCRAFSPRRFVETGVYYGASSAFILEGLRNTEGRLYSIDLPDVKYTKDSAGVHSDLLPSSGATGFVVPPELRTKWELRLGDSRIELPKLLEDVGTIDVFHHDSMHTYDLMTFEFETVLPKLRPQGLLLSDDTHWNNAFKDFCEKHSLNYRIYNHIGIAVK